MWNKFVDKLNICSLHSQILLQNLRLLLQWILKKGFSEIFFFLILIFKKNFFIWESIVLLCIVILIRSTWCITIKENRNNHRCFYKSFDYQSPQNFLFVDLFRHYLEIFSTIETKFIFPNCAAFLLLIFITFSIKLFYLNQSNYFIPIKLFYSKQIILFKSNFVTWINQILLTNKILINND